MRVVQILPTLLLGDAIGNFTMFLYELLKANGYETFIMAEFVGQNIDGNIAIKFNINRLNGDDILLYHMSTGSSLNRIIASCSNKKALIYHNITLPHFYQIYDVAAAERCKSAYRDIQAIAGKFNQIFSMSLYNTTCLGKLGIDCEAAYLTYAIMNPSVRVIPDQRILKTYSEDPNTVNILFVGRMVPHKKVEDIIRSVAWYNKHISPNVRLFLIGTQGAQNYHNNLCQYIKELHLIDKVVMPGHVNESELAAYYSCASVYVCMSEYEGFCVPLIEAMEYKIPIIAYAAAAIPNTLNQSGILLFEKSPVIIAKCCERLHSDTDFRQNLIRKQCSALAQYDKEAAGKYNMASLEKFIKDVL